MNLSISVDGEVVHKVALPPSGHPHSDLVLILDDEMEDYENAGVEIFYYPLERYVVQPCVRKRDVL